MKRSENPATRGALDEGRLDSAAESPAPDAAPRGVALGDEALLLESLTTAELQKVAVSSGLQALWQAVLPLVGTQSEKPGAYPGVFKVEPGPGADEATIYIDIQNERYEPGKSPEVERVVALVVRLSHDYRRLGDTYYCVGCMPEGEEIHH
jgi:hypothetical protein